MRFQRTIERLEQRRLLSASTLFPHLSLGDAKESAVADLNRDSKTDIVVTTSTGITVFYGDGTGKFPTKYSPTVPTELYSDVGVADFNGDGRLDIAASILGNPEIVVVSQLANGFFGPAQRLPIEGRPGWSATTGLVTPDLNGDGRADIVVGNQYDGGTGRSNFSVLISDANGGFAPHVEINVPVYPVGIVAGDFNGDGKKDVAVASQNQLGGGTNALTLHPGNGDGTFAAPKTLDIVGSVAGVAGGDVNGDGVDDLVTANGGRADISIFVASGNTFARTEIAAIPSPWDVVVADLDSNGKADIFVSGQSSVTTLFQSNGGFTAATLSTPTGHFRKFHFGDFDGDSLLDASLLSSMQKQEIWFGRAGGAFKFRSNATPSLAGATLIRLVDVNNDGARDIVSRSEYLYTPNYPMVPRISVALSNGAGGFFSPVTYSMPQATHGLREEGAGLVAADLNGDGLVDLAMGRTVGVGVGGQDQLAILYGQSGGGFGNYTTYPVEAGMRDVVAADFDNDGLTDVAISGFGSSSRFLYGQANGTLGGTVLSSMSGDKIIVCDLNADGRKDLLTSAGARILINRPNGFQTLTNPSISYEDFDLADMNGDGRLDLIVSNYPYSTPYGTGEIRIYQGLETTAASTSYFWHNPTTFTTAKTPRTLKVGDVSGDGVPDVIFIADGGRDSIGAMLGNGNGGFGKTELLNASSSQSAIAVGDVTGDGRLDIVNDVVTAVYPNLGTFAPTLSVVSVALDLDETRSITLNLSRAIKPSTVAAADLLITNLTTGDTYSAAAAVLATDRKSIQFQLPAELTNGNYRFALAADSIADFGGQGMANDFVEVGTDAFILTGDLNRDRVVNFDDLLVLAMNYGRIGQTYAQGNVTRDAQGRVDFEDLLRMAQHYGSTLFSASAIKRHKAAGRSLDVLA